MYVVDLKMKAIVARVTQRFVSSIGNTDVIFSSIIHFVDVYDILKAL